MMYRKYFHWYLFLLIINSLLPAMLNAQEMQGQPLIDSLSGELPKTHNDTTEIQILARLAVELSANDSKAALNYAEQCMKLSQKAKWVKGTGLAYQAFARTYYEISEYTTAQQNAMKAYEIFETIHDKNKMASSLLTIANTYQELGYYTKAIENDLAALRLFEAVGNKKGMSAAYNNVGNGYYQILDYDKAILNYNKALIIDKELNDKYGIGSAIDNIASAFLDEKKYDSANVYNLQGIHFFEEINHQPALARIYFNRGNLLMKLHDAKSAYAFYERAISINKKLGIKRQLSTNYGGIGELYLSLVKDSSAKYILSPLFKTDKRTLLKKSNDYFIKSITLSKSIGDIYTLMSYTGMESETQERLGNYAKALAFHKEYMTYKDSIFNDENRKKLAALENERLAEVKNKEIQLLKQQQSLEASENKRQKLVRNIILVSVGIGAVLSFLFIWSYNRRKKSAFEKQVSEVEMKALRAQMNPHFIFNSLHSINKYVVDNDKENASVYLSKFANLMRRILESSREQEIPLEKDLEALELYMQLESLRFQNRFTYTIQIDPGIDKENTLIPPLLLQPFAENAIIHGINDVENGLIKISINKENDMIRCVVEDNGVGRGNVSTVVQDENRKSKSLAVKIVNERLNIINQLKKVNAAINIFDLRDAANKPGGLRVEILLPLELAF
ncbi:MAG: histidine kinase [Agriterribacter sp.]